MLSVVMNLVVKLRQLLLSTMQQVGAGIGRVTTRLRGTSTPPGKVQIQAYQDVDGNLLIELRNSKGRIIGGMTPDRAILFRDYLIQAYGNPLLQNNKNKSASPTSNKPKLSVIKPDQH